MAKKNGNKAEAAPLADAAVDASAATPATQESKASAIGVRGPKGVALTAKITLLTKTNPKRQGSKAYDVFSKYVDGMTVQEFLDAAGDAATPNIVYDTKHGFIAVEGYNVEVLPPKAPRVAKEKVAKAPKEKKVAAAPAPDPDLELETVESEV